MYKVQIGAQLYSVRNLCQSYHSMLQCAKDIKAIGYNLCQLSGQNKEITGEEQRDILQQSGLQCVCTHLPFEKMEEDVDQIVRLHKTIGCKYPGIGSMPDLFRSSPEGILEFAKRSSIIAKKLADHGMTLIYHNHAFEFYRFPETGKTGYEILLDNAAPEMQFEMDTYWVQMGGGDVLQWIKRLSGRMDIIHFKEMNGSLANVGVIAPIGHGNMDWASIMNACDEQNVKYALVEQDNAVETDSIACMKFSYNTLKTLGGRF